jgi:4-hydroxybenzoyl-CoA reductase subunit beta
MLTLPPFELHQPESLSEVAALLSAHGNNAKILAGGTDLLPNMKHRLFTPAHVVSLERVQGLSDITVEDSQVRIGARVTLAGLAQNPVIRETWPSLAMAAEHVAGPQLREMATVGGNLCLDTRCVYYNQTYFWRKALGFCLKKDGTVCHVVKGGQNCVAAASNDTAPVLMTLDARVSLLSGTGTREVPLREFYTADGIHNTVLRPDEVLTQVSVPRLPGVRTAYRKLRVRAAVDYPALTIATALKLDSGRQLEWIRVVVSALGARPAEIKRLDSLKGRKPDSTLIEEVAQASYKQCHPLTNISVDPPWRRAVLPTLVKEALLEALSR